jgi:Lysozyme like domain
MTACHGAGGTGTQYSFAQLQGLWINAGGPAAVAPIAAAIALAESGGCTTALNATDNGGTQSSFGLWQISTGTHTPPSASWADGGTNAALAVGKYRGAGGFSPWGTYASGAYKAFLSGGTPDLNVPSGGQATATLTALTSAQIAARQATCQIWFPGFSIPIVGAIGEGCLLSKTNVRSFIGAGVMAAGFIVGSAGVLILAAYGLGKSSAIDRTADALAVLPGTGAATEGLVTASRRVNRSGGQVASERRGQRVAAERAAARKQRAAAAAAKKKAPAAKGP